MSFDSNQPTDQPPPPIPQDTGPSPEAVARERVLIPGILLIVVAVLNLLAFLYFMFNAAATTFTPAPSLKETQIAMYEAMEQSPFPMLQQMAKTYLEELRTTDPETMKSKALLITWSLAIASMIVPLLGLWAGICMLRLKTYGIAVTGAIATAIPFLSLGSCCCLGEGVGIWCLVVLLNNEVREAFR